MLNFNRIHFIGIGGVSMSALAMLASEMGVWVSGSDREYSATIDNLKSKGINAYVGANNVIVSKSDLVVYSGAVGDGDKELKFARANKIRCMERKAFLALLAGQTRSQIAVAGSHGKTTTTAMLCYVAKNMSLAFKGQLGGIICQEKSNYINTGDDYFITEACEFNKSFLALEPSIGIILNCDYDHPDTYPTLESMYDAFVQFANQSKIALVGEDVYQKLGLERIDNSQDKVYTFGFGEGVDYRAVNIVHNEGKYSFDVLCNNEILAHINLNIYGKHNILNALAVIATGNLLWLDTKEMSRCIESFEGVERRFELMGYTANDCKIIADYAHHPKEISVTIDTVRLMSKGKIVVVFQPHTFSRTKALLDEFCQCFYWADELIILPTYSAREQQNQGMSGLDLVCKMNHNGQCALYIDDYDSAEKYINQNTKAQDIVLVLGAGNIYEFAKKIAVNSKLNRK